MNALTKIATIAGALALTSQPCVAAVVENDSTLVITTAAFAADFDLQTHAQAAAAQTSASQFPLTAAISSNAALAAQEAEERERRGMSKGAKTALIVGGVVLVGVLALAVIAASSIRSGPVSDE